MKKLLVFSLLFLLFSCSKNNASKPAGNPCNEIVEVMQGGPYSFYVTASLVYDDEQRIKSVDGHGSNNVEYGYYNDSFRIKSTDINGNIYNNTIYLDKSHRATGSSFFDSGYKYDGDGYMISYKQPYGNNGQITGYTQYYLTWQNGNLVTVYTNDANVSNKNISFTYYDLPNQNTLGYNSPFYIGQIIGDRATFYLLDGPYFGKQPKNLLRSITINETPAGTITYVSDSTGRIIQDGNFL